MTLLTRELIQQKHTFAKTEVDVTEWGRVDPKTGQRERTTVFVREMSARERDDYEASLKVGKGNNVRINFRNMRAKLAAATCCDADGKLIFTSADIKWLSEKGMKVLERICNAAQIMNGLLEADDDEEEEERIKNFPKATSCSGTSSPSPSEDSPSESSWTECPSPKPETGSGS